MLREERRQHFGIRLIVFRPKKSRRGDQPTLPDFHFLQSNLTAVAGNGKNIFIFRSIADNFLFCHQFFQSLNPVAQFGSLFEVQVFGRLRHLGFQAVKKPAVPPFQKTADVLHNRTILIRRHITPTRTDATTNVKIKAGPFLADISGELAAAGFEEKQIAKPEGRGEHHRSDTGRNNERLAGDRHQYEKP